MKGPNGTLPSLTPALYLSLLSQLLNLPSSSTIDIPRVLSNVITALIHHTSLQIAQMEPVLEVLLDVGKKVVDGKDERKVGIWMGVACVSTTVRNGKAISGASLSKPYPERRNGRGLTLPLPSATLLPRYLALLPDLQAQALSTSSLLSKHINLLSSLLQLSNLPDWLRLRSLVRALHAALDVYSRKALVGLWVSEDAGKAWKRGGEVLLKPAMEGTIVGDLKTERLAGLGMISHLQRAGLLSGLPLPFLDALAREISLILAGLKDVQVGNKEVVLIDLALVGLEGLTKQRTTFWSSLVGLLQSLSVASPTAPSSYALGRTYGVVADLLALDAGGLKEIQAIVLPTLNGALRLQSTSTQVLTGLARLLPLVKPPTNDLSSYAPSLSSALLASSSKMRLAALNILMSLSPEETTGAMVLQRSAELEELEISVEGAREKCLRVAKLGRALASLEEKDVVYAEVGIRTLIGASSLPVFVPGNVD